MYILTLDYSLSLANGSLHCFEVFSMHNPAQPGLGLRRKGPTQAISSSRYACPAEAMQSSLADWQFRVCHHDAYGLGCLQRGRHEVSLAFRTATVANVIQSMGGERLGPSPHSCVGALVGRCWDAGKGPDAVTPYMSLLQLPSATYRHVRCRPW